MRVRHSRPGAKPGSVRMVVSARPGTASTKQFTRKNVILRPQGGGRMGQSISHSCSDFVDDNPEIPDLILVPDDDDDDDVHDDDHEFMEDRAAAMENEFFGRPDGNAEVGETVKKAPVHISVQLMATQMLTGCL